MACKHGTTGCVCPQCDLEIIEKYEGVSYRTKEVKAEEVTISLLREIAGTLEDWAKESTVGGWPTHHADAQKKLAYRIYSHIGKRNKRG